MFLFFGFWLWGLPYLSLLGILISFFYLDCNQPVANIFRIYHKISFVSDIEFEFGVSSDNQSVRVVASGEEYDGLSCVHVRLIIQHVFFINCIVLVLQKSASYSLSVDSSHHIYVQQRMVQVREPAYVVFVAFVQYFGVVVLGIPWSARHSHELRQQPTHSQPLHVEFPSTHIDLHPIGGWTVEMEAKHRAICEFSASGSMRIPCWNCIQPGYWFKTNILLGIYLPYLPCYFIMKSLKIEHFRESRDHHQRVFVEIAWPRLIDYLIGNHVRVIFEGSRYFPPVRLERIKYSMLIVIQSLKGPIDSITFIEQTPLYHLAVVKISNPSVRPIHEWIIGHGLRKVTIVLVWSHPGRTPVPTESFPEQVLMVLKQGIDPMLAQLVHDVNLSLQECFVEQARTSEDSRPRNIDSD